MHNNNNFVQSLMLQAARFGVTTNGARHERMRLQLLAQGRGPLLPGCQLKKLGQSSSAQMREAHYHRQAGSWALFHSLFNPGLGSHLHILPKLSCFWHLRCHMRIHILYQHFLLRWLHMYSNCCCWVQSASLSCLVRG